MRLQVQLLLAASSEFPRANRAGENFAFQPGQLRWKRRSALQSSTRVNLVEQEPLDACNHLMNEEVKVVSWLTSVVDRVVRFQRFLLVVAHRTDEANVLASEV